MMSISQRAGATREGVGTRIRSPIRSVPELDVPPLPIVSARTVIKTVTTPSEPVATVLPTRLVGFTRVTRVALPLRSTCRSVVIAVAETVKAA